MNTMSSELVLRVGSKGEIYTVKELREKLGIRPGSRVLARVEEGRLVIRPIPRLKEVLDKPVVELTPEEAERLSEEAQREKWELLG